ncbi:hypothetical protein H6G89_32550 [Oscillatoria sp. FACHB-1407]|uniref:hypothetical protein n=1 Tax=Oscillatoria sp. FACHB-1407 TaxID=2692847 RepID=UPI001683801A|nr:hypothetical protein [Oscillatoria sp. FACHB-1407]MBD2465720.1 hypothetical protein [Oscillatoria sp. FACHB-1407]
MTDVVVRAIATDNLVCRNSARYPAIELPKLAVYLVGKPASIDHPSAFRGTVKDEWGNITAAGVEKAEPPTDLDDHNKLIVQKEGYHYVWTDITCDVAVEHIEAFKKDLRRRVSIAAMYQFMRCPGCTCGEDVFSEKCPNYFWELPYFERCGVVDALEISLVSTPAVRVARVVSIDGVNL